MLEKNNEFFDDRVEVYDLRQLSHVENAKKFYKYSVNQLPKGKVNILDVSSGTRLELEFYKNKQANIDAIDIAQKMIEKSKTKSFSSKMNFICDDIFKHEYEPNKYDAIICIEVMHHYAPNKKIDLYSKLFNALKSNGCFILTDYFAKDEKEEKDLEKQLLSLVITEKLDGSQVYHLDRPLTLEHEIQCLQKAGFKTKVLKSWGQTTCIKAYK